MPALKVLQFMRDRISAYQEETGNLFNLEATPAEGVSYSLPQDRKLYPDIIVANHEAGQERGPAVLHQLHLSCRWAIPMTCGRR